MDAINWVAIVGAAAWLPQVLRWLANAFTRPVLSIHLDTKTEIGYTIFGPIFNVRLALLSQNKDAILNKFSVRLRHENGASYIFDWDGLSEDLSEIQNPVGPPMSIKKTSLPLVVKVLHTGVAQVFVRYQHKQFKINIKEPTLLATEQFDLLRSTGKLHTETEVEAMASEKEFRELVRVINSEFIWTAGKYTATFEFSSPNKFKYKKTDYSFNLSQDDIDILRKNIDNVKTEIIEMAKTQVIPNYKPKTGIWRWRDPELQKKQDIIY